MMAYMTNEQIDQLKRDRSNQTKSDTFKRSIKVLYDCKVVDVDGIKVRVSDLRKYNLGLNIEIFDIENLRFDKIYLDELENRGFGVGSNNYNQLEALFDD